MNLLYESGFNALICCLDGYNSRRLSWDTVSRRVNELFKQEIQPNSLLNCQISTLFRTAILQKALSCIELKAILTIESGNKQLEGYILAVTRRS